MTASPQYREAALRRGREAHLAFAANGRSRLRELQKAEAEEVKRTGQKRCAECGHIKSTSEFGPSKQLLSGFSSYCHECRRRQSAGRYRRWTPEQRAAQRGRIVRHRYGVDPALISLLYEQQEGCCAICGRSGLHPIDGDRTFKAQTLSIDHDHGTCAVRGLLCRQCNSALGKFGDSVATLVKAAAYLTEREGGLTLGH